MGNGPCWGRDAVEPPDHVKRLHAFEERHADVIITRPPVVGMGGSPVPWRAHRMGDLIAQDDYLNYFMDKLEELGLPEVLVSQS